MAVGRLRRWAAAGPVPVFVARGGGAGLLPVELAGDARLRLVASPRHATVLVAAGRFPGPFGVALDRVHDQLPAPRGTLWWTADPDADRPAALRDATIVTRSDPAESVVALHRDLCLGRVRSDAGVLADDPPNRFEGEGDHGQGGEGMMGGVPWGRPMAMTGDDRDGLALDRLPVVLGPFLPGFPNGLRVHAVLQGDVVQEATLEVMDLGSGPRLDAVDPAAGRARHDLRWLAEALRLAGLGALAVRAARLARAAPDPAPQAALARLVRRSGLPAAWSGVGVLDGEDARARLERRLDPSAPEPRRPDPSLERVAEVLVGQDWADAVVTICSFDLPTDRAEAVIEARS